jgi:membrane-associated protein
MRQLVDLLLHSDRHLLDFARTYGAWIYGLLFGIVFAETGFVVTPILPGDSLLFAAGTLCATGVLSTPVTFALLVAAAFTGNTVNYAIGRAVGPRVFSATDRSGWTHRLLNHDHLTRAHAFFDTYGGKAIILGRFVPVVRTFVPFVAGVAAMPSPVFSIYNFTGAAAWVCVCLGAGLTFGGFPVIKQHFSLITLGIVVVSLLPMAVELIRHRRQRTH